jgi:amidohydrolase
MDRFSDWLPEVLARQESLIALRRDFHRHPELAFREYRTAEIVARRMQAAGLDVRTGVGGTGVVAVLHGEGEGQTTAWRADMDALALAEESDLPFVSAVPGVMHACGHDGHTAIAITLAEILAAQRSQLHGTAVFIFQPAEENGQGAKAMLQDGILDDPKIDAVYGLHLVTRLPAGHVVVRSGPVMAAADIFTIKITGKGGHGAMPHHTVDPITVAANILLGLQHLIAREVSVQDPAVLTVGKIVAGASHNTIPSDAELLGTLRTLHPAVREQIKERLGSFVAHVAQAYRAKAELSFNDEGVPAVINDDVHAALVRRCAVEVLGQPALREADVAMASDDMSRFLEQWPGCYFWTGIGNGEGFSPPHHSPRFAMNEGGLESALRVALAVMLEALKIRGGRTVHTG